MRTEKAEAILEKVAISTRTLVKATHASAGKIKRLATQAAKSLGGQPINAPVRSARAMDRAIDQRQNFQAYLTGRAYREPMKYPAQAKHTKLHVQALTGISDKQVNTLSKQRQLMREAKK